MLNQIKNLNSGKFWDTYSIIDAYTKPFTLHVSRASAFLILTTCVCLQVMIWMMTLSWWRNWLCRCTEHTQHYFLGGLLSPIHPPYTRLWMV